MWVCVSVLLQEVANYEDGEGCPKEIHEHPLCHPPLHFIKPRDFLADVELNEFCRGLACPVPVLVLFPR